MHRLQRTRGPHIFTMQTKGGNHLFQLHLRLVVSNENVRAGNKLFLHFGASGQNNALATGQPGKSAAVRRLVVQQGVKTGQTQLFGQLPQRTVGSESW